MPRLQVKYEAGGRRWEVLVDGRYGHPQRVHSGLREWMYERKREDESLTARELAEEIEEKFEVELSIDHVNYLLRKVELTRPRGRPRQGKEEEESEQVRDETVPTPMAPPEESLDNGGIFFPRRGLDEGVHARR